MIRELEQPEPGSEPLHFTDKFAVSRFSQLSTILWKNRQVYWRYTGAGRSPMPAPNLCSRRCTAAFEASHLYICLQLRLQNIPRLVG